MQYTVEAFTFHSSIQHVHHNSLTKYNCRDYTQEICILKEACPSTSYVTATFHPTIGQCAHQSLSNIATPEFGMISTRNKGNTRRLTHSQGYTKLSQANIVGFIKLTGS